MPSDDHPIKALQRQLELEDGSRSPVSDALLEILSNFTLTWPLDKAAARLKSLLASDSLDRLRILVETIATHTIKNADDILKLQQVVSAEERQRREGLAKDLLADAIRKAVNTRSIERVKRIGMILANGVIEPKPPDADEIEEIMRVAVDLGEDDIRYLRELVKIEGQQVRQHRRIERHAAYTRWEHGFWGTRPDGELDGIFGKLESYGLVSRLAPSNNLNVMADIQNRYALLRKGLRFVDLIQGAS